MKSDLHSSSNRADKQTKQRTQTTARLHLVNRIRYLHHTVATGVQRVLALTLNLTLQTFNKHFSGPVYLCPKIS